MENNFKDMGFREIGIAGELLKLLSEGEFRGGEDAQGFGSLDSVSFNPNSGVVFLCDEDLNVLCLNLNDKGEQCLELWLYCQNCGEEGFRTEVDFEDRYICKSCFNKNAA